MDLSPMTLPEDAKEALDLLRRRSREIPVLVFKKSPICPVSTAAEAELSRWLGDRSGDLAVAWVDVIAQRSLARGLTAEVGVRHESPQVLFFREGDLAWHESHGGITREALSREVGA